MKRILAILCVIACLCGLCVPAMAAGTITVSVKSSWSQVNLYCWESGEMATWPGTPMTKNGDWWTLEIPAGSYTNVIANDGTNQTADLKMDGSADCWIDADKGVVYTDAGCTKPFGGSAPSTPDAPAGGVNLGGLNSLALAGTGIPGIGEWNPGDAAGDMTKVSNGIYSKVIAVTAGSTMKFKIAGNDMWDDNYNFGAAEDGATVTLGTKLDLTNGGGSKDITLTAAKDGNLKFTVDLSGETLTLLVEETDEEPGATPDVPSTPDVPEGEKITVYVQFPADWKTPAVWAWKEPGPVNATDAAWPGDLFLVKGDNGWWSVQVPNWITGLLINGNGGTVQTPDIKDFEVGKDLWINALTDPQNPVLSYEPIDVAPPAETEAPTPPVRETEGLKDNAPKNEESKGGKDLTVILAIAGAAAIIVVAVVIILIGKGKKKA